MSIALAKGTSTGNHPPLRLGVYPYRILVLWLLTQLVSDWHKIGMSSANALSFGANRVSFL